MGLLRRYIKENEARDRIRKAEARYALFALIQERLAKNIGLPAIVPTNMTDQEVRKYLADLILKD